MILDRADLTDPMPDAHTHAITHPNHTRFYEQATKRWAFPLHAFDEVMAAVKVVPGAQHTELRRPRLSPSTHNQPPPTTHTGVTVKPLPPFLTAGLRKPAIACLLSSLGGGVPPPPLPPASAAAVKTEEGGGNEEEGEGNTKEDGAAAGAAGAPEGEEDVGSLSEEGLDMRLGGRLPGVLRDALKGYQWVGAKFVVRRGGRGLIGDEMGTCG